MRGTTCSRRELGSFAAALALTGCAGVPVARAAEATPAKRGGRWYEDAFVIDACGSIGRIEVSEETADEGLSAVDLRDVRESGVTAVNLTIDDVTNDEHAADHTFDAIGRFTREVAAHGDTLTLVRTLGELRAAKAARKTGIILGFQGATALGPRVERLEAFHGLGVRIMQLTYNTRNLLGDGCLESANAGLSILGRAAVEKMNAQGILIDVSHCGQRTTAEAIELSKRPVAITHTGCAKLADRPRNKRDEEMKRCADKGGVVGIYFMQYLRTQGQPTADDVVLHVEHALDVCGEDHVAIGTDGTLSPIAVTPEFTARYRRSVEERVKQGIATPGDSADVYNFCPDLNTTRRFETLGEKLLKRGHPEARVAKILGGNFARVFGDVCG